MAIYPVAALKSAHDRAAARSFVSFLGSPVARQVLRDAGFHTP
jgi:ABC-type molybdate transport system substrate-binding protein